MIPEFDEATGCLPVGEHTADWDEVEKRFGWNNGRRDILKGLRRLASALRDRGCRLFLLDGSFITAKEHPSDFDACCDYSEIDPFELMDLRLTSSGDVMKAEYRGEVYGYKQIVPCDDRYTFREFFQSDQDDIPKGIVSLNLASVP